MTPEQLQIVFYGCEAVALLFRIYGLYEWGVWLMGRIKTGKISVARAQTFFSLAAAVVALLPFAVVAAFIGFQADGPDALFSLDNASTIFTLFGSLGLGFVIQGCAAGVFWYFTKKSAEPVQPKGNRH